MNPLQAVITILFSFSGIIMGIILSYISPEELNLGRKYFYLIKKITFLFFFFTTNTLLVIEKRYLFVFLFTIPAIILFILQIKETKKTLEFLTYGLYFLISISFINNSFLPLLATIVFIYGLPTGSLLRDKFLKI